jgi:hypothetical protein
MFLEAPNHAKSYLYLSKKVAHIDIDIASQTAILARHITKRYVQSSFSMMPDD